MELRFQLGAGIEVVVFEINQTHIKISANNRHKTKAGYGIDYQQGAILDDDIKEGLSGEVIFNKKLNEMRE